MHKKDSAIFSTANFNNAEFDIYFFPKMDKARFVSVADRAFFDMAHFDDAFFDGYSAISSPRFEYARFDIINPLFETLKEQTSKSLV